LENIKFLVPWFIISKKEGGEAQTHFRLQIDKQPPPTQKVQVGTLERHISISKKRHVGLQNRFEACLFSPPSTPRVERIFKHKGGRKVLSIPSSPLWSVNSARNLDKNHESFSEKVESKRDFVLDLSGRYFGSRKKPKKVRKGYGSGHSGPKRCRNGNKLQEEHFGTLPKHTTFGVQHRLQGGLQVPQDKLKSIKKELGKLVKFTTMSPRKMSAILGQVRSFLVAMPLLRSFTDMMLAFIRKQQVWGWDMEHPIPK
jgi:hypothetical protein